jgi:protein-S-isoprenylcysteine O-methyltransferase Ste14
MDNKSEFTQQEMKSLILKIIIRFPLMLIFLGLMTLLPAGTFNYWQFYTYMAIIVIPMMFVLSYFLKNDPSFLERRTRIREKEKQQKIIQSVFSLLFFSVFIICGFDRRYGWSDVPLHIVVLADIAVLTGYIIIFFVFKQNSYASRIVEVDKNQTVISTGLYGIIRHPMYAGVIIMYLPTPISLGSYWGLIPVATIPLALVLRIINEEKVLNQDLPGYKEYCQKTKYRLIPFLW